MISEMRADKISRRWQEQRFWILFTLLSKHEIYNEMKNITMASQPH